jgi:hypothetical protein
MTVVDLEDKSHKKEVTVVVTAKRKEGGGRDSIFHMTNSPLRVCRGVEGIVSVR